MATPPEAAQPPSPAGEPDLPPELGRHAPRLRGLRELRDASVRRREGVFLLEGPHLLERLLLELDGERPAPYRLRAVLISEAYAARWIELSLGSRLREIGAEAFLVGERVLDGLADTQSPQGVLALVESPGDARDLAARAAALTRRRTLRIVLAEGIADPGNLGTLARTAAGMGAHLFVTHGGADPFGPKVLRATAGAFLGLPYGEVADPVRMLRRLSREGVTILAAVAAGGRPLTGFRPPPRCVVLLGSEAHGLPSGWLRHADVKLTIQLHRGVESLNVAVAGSILLWHLSGSRARPAR